LALIRTITGSGNERRTRTIGSAFTGPLVG
jgi:hypothetical protein